MRRIAVLIGRTPGDRHSAHVGYADALWACGATPLLITPPDAPEAMSRYKQAIASCDALCLTGGGDIDPRLYGQAPTERLRDVDAVRDAAELEAVHLCIDAGVPILGICRGAQMLAVALGGELHQDLVSAGFPDHWEEERQGEPVHGLRARWGTAAHSALGGAQAVNSIHHQAIADPGPNLEVSAWSSDGVIEAVEGERALGVQWHPERLWRQFPEHIAPFEWLLSL